MSTSWLTATWDWTSKSRCSSRSGRNEMMVYTVYKTIAIRLLYFDLAIPCRNGVPSKKSEPLSSKKPSKIKRSSSASHARSRKVFPSSRTTDCWCSSSKRANYFTPINFRDFPMRTTCQSPRTSTLMSTRQPYEERGLTKSTLISHSVANK